MLPGYGLRQDARFRAPGPEYTFLNMDFRTDSNHRPQDQDSMNPNDPALPPSDDQRSHPRGGTLEQIADIAYDTLRKHEGPWQSDESSSNDSP